MKLNPLLDINFLKELTSEKNRTTYARITSLTNDEYPIERIEGIVTAGSINIDGKSAVRRVCNLTVSTTQLNINNVYWGLSTKVKIEIGLENKYNSKYDNIIWIPLGIYVLNSFKTTSLVNKYQITLSGKDKMCLLNGDISGNFNAETLLDSEYVQLSDGTWENQKKPIAYIIREMIHHYAKEHFHNILIKDIDTLSLKVLNNKKTTFYLIKDSNGDFVENEIYYVDTNSSILSKYRYEDDFQIVNFNAIPDTFQFDNSIDEDDNPLIIDKRIPSYITYENKKYTVVKIEPGEDIGYELTETYYPDELIAGVGETVTSVLDKIIKTFGDYEYFYNIDGLFIFLKKDIYVNTKWNDWITIENKNYISPEEFYTKVKYNFEGNFVTTAYQNTPNLGNIKNDFTVWGTKKTAAGNEIPIHMRYAIDKKPEYYKKYKKTEDDPDIAYVTETFINKYPTFSAPYNIVDWREIIYLMAIDYYLYNHDDDFTVNIQMNNYIKELNIHYYDLGYTGYEQYYHDIEGFWRLLYAPKEYLDEYEAGFYTNNVVDKNDFYDGKIYTGPWTRKRIEEPSELLFWFDFFDSDNLGIGQFSVSAIGDRPINKKNDSVHALIYKDIPDVIFISTQEEYDNYKETGRLLTGYLYIIGNEFINKCIEEDKILLSTRSITAKELIDDLLYNHAFYNETINITSIPIYYLEPNTIISATDEQRTVNGYYIINKITLPLDYKGTMKITAIRVPDRAY